LKTLIQNGFLTQYQIADKSKIAISTVRQATDRLWHKGLAAPSSAHYLDGVLEAQNWKPTTEGVRVYLSTLELSERIRLLKAWAWFLQNTHIRTLDEIDPDGTLQFNIQAGTWIPSSQEFEAMHKKKQDELPD